MKHKAGLGHENVVTAVVEQREGGVGTGGGNEAVAGDLADGEGEGGGALELVVEVEGEAGGGILIGPLDDDPPVDADGRRFENGENAGFGFVMDVFAVLIGDIGELNGFLMFDDLFLGRPHLGAPWLFFQ